MTILELAPEQAKWRDTVLNLVPEFARRARTVDETGEYPHENVAQLRDAGILKLAVPREYGGVGNAAGFCALIPHLVIEVLGTVCANTGWALLTHFHHCGLLAGLGNEEQKSRIFSDVVEHGALLASLGSEVQPAQAKAAKESRAALQAFQAGFKPVPGGFSATATKGFCSTAPVADYLFYWGMAPDTADNSSGLVIAVIEKASPGISFLPGWEEVIGIRASLSGGARLEEVFVPWRNVLGEPGDYVQLHPYTFDLSYAVLLLGIAQGAYDFIIQSLRDRPYLRDDDTVVFAVGEMSSALQATRCSWRYAQSLWDEGSWGEAHHASLRALHMAKLTAKMVTTGAFDVLGTRALFKYNPIERAWRDMRVVTLHTRESQFMRLVATGDITGKRFAKEKFGAPGVSRKTWAELGYPRDA